VSSTRHFLSRELIATLVVSLLAGWVVGHIAWCLVIGLFSYMLWHQRQLSRLYEWAMNDKLSDPPVSHGVWGELFDRFHRTQRANLKQRVRLKKVIKRFRDSTFALHDGFVMIDAHDNLDWWNPAAERLLGLRKTDQGQQVTNLLRDPSFRQYFKSHQYDKAIEMISPLNHEVTLHCQISAFGKRDRLMVVRDITELKKLDRVRKDFVANVSHELRTPLTVVSGYLETMSENTDSIPRAWAKAMPQMLQQTQRMNNLIQDLLMLSNLESRATAQRHQVVDMTSLLRSICHDLQTSIDDKQQTLELNLDSHTRLLGQHQELYSLASNLISNASKYSPEQSTITVNWREVNGDLCLEVSDNGPGIAPQHIPRLTERFYRVDEGRAQTTGGTGLGLSIVKHILINHDGQLEIQSQFGKGSQFICLFHGQRAASGTLTAVG